MLTTKAQSFQMIHSPNFVPFVVNKFLAIGD
jgi:hypothetical protein